MGGLSRLPTVYRNPKKAIKEWNSKLRKGIMTGSGKWVLGRIRKHP
jgi:hypothetical protein